MQKPSFNLFRPAQAWLVVFYGSIACANASKSLIAAIAYLIMAILVLALAIATRFRPQGK